MASQSPFRVIRLFRPNQREEYSPSSFSGRLGFIVKDTQIRPSVVATLSIDLDCPLLYVFQPSKSGLMGKHNHKNKRTRKDMVANVSIRMMST